MDFNQILHTLQNAIPTAIWYLIPFFLVAAVIKSPWFKGPLREFVVNTSARLFLDTDACHRIKKLILLMNGNSYCFAAPVWGGRNYGRNS